MWEYWIGRTRHCVQHEWQNHSVLALGGLYSLLEVRSNKLTPNLLTGCGVSCLALQLFVWHGMLYSSLLQENEHVRYNKYYNNKPFRHRSPNMYKSFWIIYEAEGGCFGTQISHCGNLSDILENHSSNNYTFVLQCSML